MTIDAFIKEKIKPTTSWVVTREDSQGRIVTWSHESSLENAQLQEEWLSKLNGGRPVFIKEVEKWND